MKKDKAKSNLNELKDIPIEELTDKEKKEIKGHIYEFLENQRINILARGHRQALMYIKAMTIFFEKRRNKRVSSNNFNIGEIYFANMLLAYDDEVSYEHPVLILSKGEGSLFIVPATSNVERKSNSYNLKLNKGTENLIIIPFKLNPKNSKVQKIISENKNKNLEEIINVESVFQLNNAQMISTARISGSIHYGEVNLRSENFLYAENYLFEMMFGKFKRQLAGADKTNDNLKKKITKLEDQIKELETKK